MKLVIGIVVGLVWGMLAGFLNTVITRKALSKESAAELMSVNLLRTAVDIAALAVVFFLRRVLPFSFEATLVGTAIGLSLVTIVFAYRFKG